MSMLPRKHGPWTINAQREVYSDPWVGVRRDEVTRPDGNPGSYCVVRIKPGVCVLAMDEQQQVHLTEEFHYGVGRITLECVSGGMELGEQTQAAAERELLEELGIAAGCWTDLGVVDPFTANVVSPTHLYLARELTFGPTNLDGGEVIEHRTLPLAEAVEAVMRSEITHAPSCLAILKTSRLLA